MLNSLFDKNFDNSKKKCFLKAHGVQIISGNHCSSLCLAVGNQCTGVNLSLFSLINCKAPFALERFQTFTEFKRNWKLKGSILIPR
jgi:hypothetical protein